MPDFNLLEVGQRISRIRIAMGLTQQEIYEKIDISANHYSRIENGHSGMSYNVLIQLCEVLHTSVDYILTGKTDISQNSHNDAVFEFMKKYAELSNKQKKFILRQMDLLKEMNIK